MPRTDIPPKLRYGRCSKKKQTSAWMELATCLNWFGISALSSRGSDHEKRCSPVLHAHVDGRVASFQCWLFFTVVAPGPRSGTVRLGWGSKLLRVIKLWPNSAPIPRSHQTERISDSSKSYGLPLTNCAATWTLPNTNT